MFRHDFSASTLSSTSPGNSYVPVLVLVLAPVAVAAVAAAAAGGVAGSAAVAA